MNTEMIVAKTRIAQNASTGPYILILVVTQSLTVLWRTWCSHMYEREDHLDIINTRTHRYTNDAIACGSDFYAYEAMVANGHDARLLSFPPGSGEGGHKGPENQVDWIVGCLGIMSSCSSTIFVLDLIYAFDLQLSIHENRYM